MSEISYYIGIDVGSTSARSAVVSSHGDIIAFSSEKILIKSENKFEFEHCSDNIWNAVLKTMKEAINFSNVEKSKILGIGFDATCSLVLLNHEGKKHNLPKPNTASLETNTLMWMDIRAAEVAKEISVFCEKNYSEIIKSTGGSVSPEMSLSKIVYLKKFMEESWFMELGSAMELPDFLTFKATGSNVRSKNCLNCKWGYNNAWNYSFFEHFGLRKTDVDIKFGGVSNEASEVGCRVGYLLPSVLEFLGFEKNQKISVASGLIDAYAGALASLALESKSVYDTISLIAGTSTCHILPSPHKNFVKGVWGPYEGVLIPNSYTLEGGSNCSGMLLMHLIETHPYYKELIKITDDAISYLNNFLTNCKDFQYKSKHFHILPDFHGNRSPLSDISVRGSIVGLGLGKGIEDLAILYLAAVQALCYSAKHVITSMQENNIDKLSFISLAGGLVNNALFCQTLADVTQLPVLTPKYVDECVLIGSAITAQASVNVDANLVDIMSKMSKKGLSYVPPKSNTLVDFHQKKYIVFLKLYADEKKYKEIMND
ncbi:hypothetical protein HDU92_001465 [Lobulomyces angularis]|nr:hypothetical protein HDU92_001465 [Lobulomyces angularis]